MLAGSRPVGAVVVLGLAYKQALSSRLYVCVCICVYVCICVCMCVYVRTRTYTYVYGLYIIIVVCALLWWSVCYYGDPYVIIREFSRPRRLPFDNFYPSLFNSAGLRGREIQEG